MTVIGASTTGGGVYCTEVLPLSATVPCPVIGWVRSVMVNGTLPSGSLSLASRFKVSATPKLVPPWSACATGGWFSASTGAFPTITTGSVSLPPAADLIVTVAGGWATSLTVRVCSVPDLDSRP
ncbi:hypothetical protein D3C77_451310 [compost metagenome]